MKLDFFDKIDSTIGILKEMTPIYEDVCETLESFFEGLMIELEQPIISIKTRVKNPKSLKEKILRNKLYQKHETPEEIIDNLHDLVGIMIFCRFVYEEELILQKLKEFFTSQSEDGWYYSEILQNVPIYLDLSAKQPQKQKNGFNIYRVDGYYYSYGEKVNFELQIKSLVHSFWSDIEHEIIYKNNNYIIVDDFVKEMLSSIYMNMESMDHQISLIYKQINDETENQKDIKNENLSKVIIAKSINDIFIKKMRQNLGFTIDFKKACDIISQYIFVKNEIVYQNMSGKVMLELIDRIDDISNIDIDFETPIEFESKYKPKSRFGEILSEKLLNKINEDFEWNIFFKILFEIEPGSNVEDFGKFLYVIKTRYMDANLYDPIFARYAQSDAYDIKDEIIVTVAKALANNATIKIIYEENFEKICKLISDFTNQVSTLCSEIDDWEENKEELLLDLEKKITKVLG